MSKRHAANGGDFLLRQAAPEEIATPESLTAESRLIARTMEEFTRREVGPVIARLEAQEPDLLPVLLKKAGGLGLLAGGTPERYGGLGLSKSALALLTEKAAPYLSFAISMGVHAGVATLPLLFFGTEAQKAHYLPQLASGERLGAFALSEASSGSDAFAARTRAVLSPEGTHYLLTGEKLWTTNGGFADLFTVFAKVDGEQFTAFLVDRETPGLVIGREEHKMGLHGSSTRRILLQDAQVPVANVLGEVGRGHRPALYALNVGRFHIGVTALGAAKECLRAATQYASQRAQFGRPIAAFPLIRQKLATLATRIYLLESMAYRVAGCWDNHAGGATAGSSASAAGTDFEAASDARFLQASEEFAIECAILKFFGTEVLALAADESLQIHGGFGFSEEFAAARMYRDARVFRIFEGTNEINRLTVLDQLLRRNASGRLDLASAGLPGAASSSNAGRLSDAPHAGEPSDLLAEAGACVRSLRAVIGEVLRAGRESQGARLGENQAFAAPVADLAATLFALESAWLRASQKAGETGDSTKPGTDLATAMVLNFASEAGAQTEITLRAACAALQTGPFLSLDSDALNALRRLPVRSPAPFQEQIAQAVIEKEGYPF